MSNYKSTYANDLRCMETLLHEPSLHKKAQETGGMTKTIEQNLSKVYDPEHPVESVLAFIGPGILWMFGLKWITVAYGLAEALGFNWEKFFVSIREKLEPILKSMVDGNKPNPDAAKSIVEDTATGSFTEEIDPKKLIQQVTKEASIHDLMFIKKLAKSGEDPWIYQKILEWIEKIGGSKLRRGFVGFIVRMFSWVLGAVIISAGVLIGSSAASNLLGTDKKKDESGETNADGTAKNNGSSKDENIVLNLNTKADPSLFNETFNNESHVWILNYNINNIKEQLIKWAQELYPQLTDINAFNSSQAFNDTVKMFHDRNKGNQLEMIAVPQPFTSIKSIVWSFAGDVANHMQSKSTI